MNGNHQPRDELKGPRVSQSRYQSSLGLLRQSLPDPNLRGGLHRPHYPSPLSQSPLQASISSASHTAASVASSSRSTITTSTTPPSTSSRFSINQAFKSLTEQDIEFFDRLISTLPSHASDFSQLKSAYTAHLPDELDRRQRRAGSTHHTTQLDWDAHLWSVLLSLVKVRGKNWRERWDSVRLAFGLDPNSGDETDLGASTQSTSTSTSATASPTQEHDSHESLESPESHRQFLPHKPTALAPPHSFPPQQMPSHPSFRPSQYDLGLPRSSSPPPRHRQTDKSTSKSETLHDDPADEHGSQLSQSPPHGPISAIQARLRRLMQSDEHDNPVNAEPSELQSSNQASYGRHIDFSGNALRLPNDAKRRFDQLVQSSQSARATLRQSQLAEQARQELNISSQQLQAADLWRARKLLQNCLAWWMTLTRQQLAKSQNAADASARVLVEKSLQRWKTQAQSSLQSRRVGEKTDRVRCTLTAFRTWKRLTLTARERREDSKKDSMRAAYYATTSAVKKRLLKDTFLAWKQQHMQRCADTVRKRHLQSGAFALWQLRSSHIKQLQSRENIFKVTQNHSILSQAYERWSDRSEKVRALRLFQHHRDRLLILHLIHTWRQRTLLSGLSRAFSQRRLKLAALDSWKQSLEKQQLRRKQEAFSNRWRTRRLKQNAMALWLRQKQKVERMQREAIDMQVHLQKDKVADLFHHWQVRSRAALFERVCAAGILERTFSHWKHSYTALTISLNQRESAIVLRRNESIKVAHFFRWRQLAKQIRDREAHAQAHRKQSICTRFFLIWRNKQLQHRLVGQKSEAVSDYFTLRSTLHQWQQRLRERRGDAREAGHNRRLVEQVFDIWRSKAAKQQRLETVLQQFLAQSNGKLARMYLDQWVTKIIEVRNRELEVKEQREKRLLKAAFYAWIEACLRHDDLLALMNSYIDVKEEDSKRLIFLHWLEYAREQKQRRHKAETLANSTRIKTLATMWSGWRDKLKERALASQEYEMLVRRQQLSQQWALHAWQSRTLLLPAIRMRNTSLKRSTFQQWRRNLPGVQMSNQATSMVRKRLVQQSWQMWKENLKARRQFRAAARFGAGSISAQRLRSLALAATRSTLSSSPSAPHSWSPTRAMPPECSSPHSATPLPRPRTSMALRTSAPTNNQALPPRSGRSDQRDPSFSRRATSVPRHLETSFTSESIQSSRFRSDGGALRPEAVSPSKEASARRARSAAAAVSATPTSNSISEQSRFSLAMKSSTSSISATHAHAPQSAHDAVLKSRRQTHTVDKGPTLCSAAQRSSLHGNKPRNTDSDFATRVKRSAKYERSQFEIPDALDFDPAASDDGLESRNSVQSAPARSTAVDTSRTPRKSLAVAQDMILQLRAKAASRQQQHRLE